MQSSYCQFYLVAKGTLGNVLSDFLSVRAIVLTSATLASDCRYLGERGKNFHHVSLAPILVITMVIMVSFILTTIIPTTIIPMSPRPSPGWPVS